MEQMGRGNREKSPTTVTVQISRSKEGNDYELLTTGSWEPGEDPKLASEVSSEVIRVFENLNAEYLESIGAGQPWGPGNSTEKYLSDGHYRILFLAAD